MISLDKISASSKIVTKNKMRNKLWFITSTNSNERWKLFPATCLYWLIRVYHKPNFVSRFRNFMSPSVQWRLRIDRFYVHFVNGAWRDGTLDLPVIHVICAGHLSQIIWCEIVRSALPNSRLTFTWRIGAEDSPALKHHFGSWQPGIAQNDIRYTRPL